jgi:two-component system chemotaxis response regulator CheY
MQRLILVDGSVIIRKVGKRILSDLGYLVTEAEDVHAALTLCEGGLPSVLVVDACLDEGTDLIREVRNLPGGDAVKIYYCLIEAKLKTMMQGKRAGADDFLLKPFDRETLTKTFADQSRTAA